MLFLDVQKFFDGYGKIVDCRVMSGFGFVEFENSRVGNFCFLSGAVAYILTGRRRDCIQFQRKAFPRPKHYC
jgi:hypothetical protein